MKHSMKKNELVGFFCITTTDGEFEIGLGLKPDLCGNGLGKDFLKSIEMYIQNKYQVKKYKLAVALFNKRAINVYIKCGYIIVKKESRKIGDAIIEFVIMEKCLD